MIDWTPTREKDPDKPNYGYAIGAVLGGLLSLGLAALAIHFLPWMAGATP